jgi:hypothetical protein
LEVVRTGNGGTRGAQQPSSPNSLSSKIVVRHDDNLASFLTIRDMSNPAAPKLNQIPKLVEISDIIQAAFTVGELFISTQMPQQD